MTARKDRPPAATDISGMIKTLHEDGTVRQLETRYLWRTFRFLFDGGKTVDVVAIADNSDLRGWVLRVTGYPGIVGVAVIEGSDQ